MSRLGKLWAGRVYGTNTGNIFLSFDEDNEKLSGTFRFLDDQYGVAVYNIEGNYGESVSLHGKPIHSEEGINLGEIEIEGALTPEGVLKGTWETTLGTGGLFTLYQHGEGQKEIAGKFGGEPEQFYTQNIELGALTLFEDDIRRLIENILVDFDSGRAVVTYNDGGPDVTRYADDFISNPPQNTELKYLKVFVKEPDAHSVDKNVNVEISEFGINEVRVQGVRESWVIGKSSAIVSSLKKNESFLVTKYKKFGLNLNQFIFISMLVAILEIESLKSRGIFVVFIFIILSIFYWVHSKFIPNAKLNLTKSTASTFERFWPTLTSWVLAASASLAAALVFWSLLGEAP